MNDRADNKQFYAGVLDSEQQVDWFPWVFIGAMLTSKGRR